MAQWIEFTKDWDREVETREAVEAYKAGQTLYLVKEIAEAALAAKVAKPAEKPDASDDASALATTTDDGRGGDVVVARGDDAHRGALRVELRDATAGERPAG